MTGPLPDCQMPPSEPLGVSLKADSCAKVAASYDITQPLYGGVSQCEAHAMKTRPAESASPARWFCVWELNATLPPSAGAVAVITTGLCARSLPVVTSMACRRCTNVF